MRLSRNTLIPMIAGGLAISILVGFALAYPGTFAGDDGGNNDNDGGIVEVGNGELDSCEPPSESDAVSEGNSLQDDESGLVRIGNPIGTDRFPAITALTLKDPQEKISFRFTAKYTGLVQSLAINLLQSTGNQTDFRVGLQDDGGNGRPSGNWISPPGLGNTQTDRNGFITVELEQAAELQKDEVYHLVVETTEPARDVSNEVRLRVYDIHLPFQPLNEDEPDILWKDDTMNVLYYDGNTWQVRNQWPVFVVSYGDGERLGQPYSLAAQWVIYDGRHTGQQIVPSSDYVLERFGFSVAAKGRPADNLCYEVRDSENALLAKGFFAGPDDLSIQAGFVEVGLNSPLTLEKDKLYRIALYSHGTSFEEPYHLYGHEFVYDENIGYGGVRNILTASYDKGATWRDWVDADTIFSLSAQKV